MKRLLSVVLLFLLYSQCKADIGIVLQNYLIGGMRLNISIIVLPLFIASVVLYFYLLRKRKAANARKLLHAIAIEDPVWNVDLLEEITFDLYFKYQKAWAEQDLSVIASYLTPGFYQKNCQRLALQVEEGVKYHRENIKIKILDIVGVEDYQNNDKDRFKAYIEAYLDTYTSFDGEIHEMTEKYKREEQIYTFCRKGDVWLLDNIENTFNQDKLSEVSSYKEPPHKNTP